MDRLNHITLPMYWRSAGELSLARLLVYFALLILIATVVNIIYLLKFHPLSKIPGPFLARITFHWQGYHNLRFQRARTVQEAHKRYGPVIRVGPNHVSFNNPAALRSIYGNASKFPKTDEYKWLKFTSEDNVFNIRDIQQHTGRKKLLAKTYAQGPIMASLPQTLERTVTMFQKFEAYGDQPVDIYRWLLRFTVETVFIQTFGIEPKMIENGEDHPVFNNLDHFLRCTAWSIAFPTIRKFATKIPIKSIREPFKALAGWNKYGLAIVQEERTRTSDQRSPFIGQLMSGPHKYLDKPLSDLQVAEELVAQIFAGSGTTANTLAFLINAVARDRRVYGKLKEELVAALPDWPRCEKGPPNAQELFIILQNLPYMNAVISETLRAWPTFSGLMPRKVTAGGIELGGYYLPENTIVGAQNLSLHYNPEYFDNPDQFIPERFLDERAERSKEGLNGFSIGTRSCSGRNLAMTQLQLVAPLFFRYFDVKRDACMANVNTELREAVAGTPHDKSIVLRMSKSAV